MKIFFVEPPPSHKKTSLTGVSVDVRSDGLPMKSSSSIRRTSWRRLRPGAFGDARGAGTYRLIASHRMREACRSCFRVDAVGANVGDGVAAEDVETGVGCSSACRVRSWLVVKTQIVRGRTYRTSRYESITIPDSSCGCRPAPGGTFPALASGS